MLWLFVYRLHLDTQLTVRFEFKEHVEMVDQVPISSCLFRVLQSCSSSPRKSTLLSYLHSTLIVLVDAFGINHVAGEIVSSLVLVRWSDLGPPDLAVDPDANVHHFVCEVRALDLA